MWYSVIWNCGIEINSLLKGLNTVFNTPVLDGILKRSFKCAKYSIGLAQQQIL
ncbi:MAG: hypothetical protein ACRC4N_09480 [Gammaproteobacteria bacterium]